MRGGASPSGRLGLGLGLGLGSGLGSGLGLGLALGLGLGLALTTLTRFTFRQIFAYYRDTIQFREQGSAAELLKCINPREARLLDRAAQVHVRFRLGGMVFPPTVYYKIYAHGAVTDVGAYAPRDYTAAR